MKTGGRLTFEAQNAKETAAMDSRAFSDSQGFNMGGRSVYRELTYNQGLLYPLELTLPLTLTLNTYTYTYLLDLHTRSGHCLPSSAMESGTLVGSQTRASPNMLGTQPSMLGTPPCGRPRSLADFAESAKVRALCL